MTDFATLSADVAGFSARSDLGAQIPTFIRLAEARIAREIRVFEMQTHFTAVIDDTGRLTLPTDFLGFRHVAVAITSGISENGEATYLPPDVFFETLENAGSVVGFVPDNYYTLESGDILIQPVPGPGLSVSLNTAYWQRFAPLDGTTNLTNWLLTNHFDIYLTAVLAELASFEMDVEEEGKQDSKFRDKVKMLHQSERRKQRSGPYIRRPRFAP